MATQSVCVRFYETGDASVLRFDKVPVAEPGSGEVRIKVYALGLNRAEVLLRQGLYLEKPTFPSRIGYEASGVIEAIGEGVEGFTVGQKVSTIPCFSQTKYGVYGEHAIVPARSLARYPDNLSDEQAAAIWMQYLTAYGALMQQAGLKAGQYVLITAASSSVGFAAIQIVKREGAIAIATTRSASKKDSLLAAGADYVIVTDESDILAECKIITRGKGVDIVFDAVAGSSLMTLARAAAHEGKIYLYGALSLETTVFPFQLALKKGLSVSGYTMFQVTEDPERMAQGQKYVYDGLADGTLVPVIDRVFPFKKLAQAHEYMESNQQKGKIVVSVP